MFQRELKHDLYFFHSKMEMEEIILIITGLGEAGKAHMHMRQSPAGAAYLQSFQEKDCQKKGVQKLSEGSERFFAPSYAVKPRRGSIFAEIAGKRVSEKRSAKIERGQRAVFCSFRTNVMITVCSRFVFQRP